MRSLLNFRILFLVAVLALLLGVKVPHIQAAAGDVPIRGYAWSDNVGWLSFSCENNNYCANKGGVDYGVFIGADGSLFGYAWSDNIGWVSFNTADLTGCPSGTCEARYNSGSGTLSGWARALAYQDPEKGGWDGWISLSDTRASPKYGVTVNASTGEFGNYAWSDMVMGWLSFNCANTGTCGTSPYKVYAMFSNASVVELNGNGSIGSITITQGQSATLAWTMQNVTNPVPSSSPADASWNSTVITLPTGSKVVTPTVTTTYTITATGTGGPVTSSVTVTVVPAGGAATLTVVPLNAQTIIGGTQQFIASYDQDGSGTAYAPIDVTASATWTSTITTVATVTSGGKVTGVAAGNTIIRASYSGLNAETSLTVASSNAPSLTISPAAVNLAVGGTQQFTATYDQDGSSGPIAPVNVTNNAATSWSSSNPSVTSVNTSGFATAQGAGAASINVTYNSMSMTDGASVSVTLTGSVPVAPTITATSGNTQNVINVGAVTGAISYNIYWSTTSGVTKTNGTKITGITSPYTHSGLTNSTTYYYIATAVNSYGESAASSQVSATPSSTGGTAILSVNSSNPSSGVAITGVTADINGAGNGSTFFTRTYNTNTAVNLTAPGTATGGNTFSGWTNCDSTSGNTCTVTMSANKTVTANYTTPSPTPTLSVAKTGTGSGTVTSSPSGINCGSTCSYTYTLNASVTLTAAANSGSTFAGWSGDCSGTGATCTLTMSAAKSATATFTASTATFTGNGAQGTVSILPPSQGGHVDLQWNITGMTSCTASSNPSDPLWNGTKPVSGGPVTLTPSQSTTYSLSCSGPGGSGGVISLIVDVTEPYFTLQANPSSVPITFQKDKKDVCANVDITALDILGYNSKINLPIFEVNWGGLIPKSSSFKPTSLDYSGGSKKYNTSTFSVCLPGSTVQNVYHVFVKGVGTDSYGKTDLVEILFNVMMASPTWKEI